MKTIYVLWHKYEQENGEDEIKEVGYYTSRENAELAIKRLIVKPGFCDYPDGFEILETQLDSDGWPGGFAHGDPWANPPDGYYDELGFLRKKKP